MKAFLAVAAVVLLASHLASTAYVPYNNHVAKMAMDNVADLEVAKDSAYNYRQPEMAKDSAYDYRQPEMVKDSAYDYRPPEMAKDSAYDYRPPEMAKDSAYDYGQPEMANDSAYDYRQPEVAKDSVYDYRQPEVAKDSAYDYRPSEVEKVTADDYQPEVQGDPTIAHNDTIALQLVIDSSNWLGCAPAGPCVKATCPGLKMQGADWDNCWGEVFEIYRFEGPGNVLVGDIIGINYPRQKNLWLGCAAPDCVKANCPGVPTPKYGMADDEKWFRCWGEVFKIYAYNKSEGDTIDQDRVLLYYLQGDDWLGLVDNEADHRTCPGKNRPPSNDKYDKCWGEVFKIWKKP